MRRVLGLASAALLAAASTACAADASRPGAAPSTPLFVGRTATPSPGDPAVTKQVCEDAARATAAAAKYFNDELTLLELAAARGDQLAVVAAADAIQARLTQLAGDLAAYAKETVSPRVRVALTQANAALTEISSESYPGTQADISRKLTDLGSVFAEACG